MLHTPDKEAIQKRKARIYSRLAMGYLQAAFLATIAWLLKEYSGFNLLGLF